MTTAIKINDIVVADGEQFTRLVVEVSDDRALCRRFSPNEKDVRWLLISDLRREDGRPFGLSI